MDLITLTINLEKEPKSYVEEFRRQIQSYLNMCRLPKQPHKTIRQTLDVLIKFSHVDKERVAEAVVESVGLLKSYKLKKSVLSALLSMTYKRLIEPRVCIKMILDHSSDPGYFINKVKTFIDRDSSSVIQQYYEIGDEKQKIFCYYFLMVLFVRFGVNSQHEICKGLFGEGKVKRLCFKYFLGDEEEFNVDLLDESCKVYGKKLYSEIANEKDEREMRIMKMQVYVLFKKRFNLKASIVPIALAMIDPDREDIKDCMNLIVDSVSEKELEGVLKTISIHLCSPFKEEELICYGLNLLRFIFLKYSESNSESDSDSDSIDEHESTNSSTANSLHNSSTANSKISPFLVDLRDKILNYVECFKDSKVKSISYAYRAISNSLKMHKDTGREINFILRKLTKEERLDLHRKNKESNKVEREIYKSEKKELRKKKSKRKFKLSKKRIKLNLKSR
ncbi:hypothetical protein NGRA_1223 [Nosema granulosis]|uniref:Protein SDA1 n=1 Tax=Nosema granulosis TaxID=83296 RepID=A0A9P6GYV8_9MICR|nr:hypothetical protein NGRA_1223 [Nosema granulosis]